MFCVKRILFALGTKVLYLAVAINIGLYFYLSLFTLGYNLVNRPMNTRIIQWMDNTNEFFILLSGYAIMLFSGWIFDFDYDRDDADNDIPDDLELRYNLGFCYLAFLMFSVAVNLIIVIFEISRMIRKKNHHRVFKIKLA
jgi:hypothetical protein